MRRYLFNGFEFDPASGIVVRPDGSTAGLRPKAADILHILLQRHGEAVSRDTLMELVWPGVFVTDDNITQGVSEIRRALGDAAPQLLRTLSRRGYRLAVERAAEVCHALPDRPSIAVLPFINLSGNPQQEFLSDGIADEIIGLLARGGAVIVIARSSSFSYKGRRISAVDIARELAVRYILEGRVRQDGDTQISVSVHLVDGETGVHVWARRYDRALTAVFTVLDEIAQAVASELAPAIAGAELQRAIRKPPAGLNAWESYQRGLWHMTRPANNTDLGLAGGYFRRAVELDPLFADAYAMLSRCHVAEATQGEQPLGDGLRHAEAAARAALRLDSDNAAAHVALAWVRSNMDSGEAALEHAAQAIALNMSDPNGWLVRGHLLVFAHRPLEAGLALETALRLDPRGRVALGVAHHRAVSLYLEGEYAACVVAAREVMRRYPDFGRTSLYLIASLSQLGRTEEASGVLGEVLATAPKFLGPRLATRPPYVRIEDHDRMLHGLQRAGWQG